MTGNSKHTNLKSQWRCPSNIALVKYWGKRDFQLPVNPSLSFALQHAYTETSVELTKPTGQKAEFRFEGGNVGFADRLEKYLDHLSARMPWIDQHSFRIESRNSFPHSAGIASSASAYGALALCLTELDFIQAGKVPEGPDFLRQASELARIGSGSASRSVFPGFALWGKTQLFESSSDEYAIPLKDGIHPVFQGLHDAILLVDPGRKEVSSSAGHKLMDEHLFKRSRIAQAHEHIHALYLALLTGNQKNFVEVVENEALSLHAMMMTSNPSFILLKPNTLELIARIRHFREKSGIPLCFTIDAGPNVHLLYFQENEAEVKAFVDQELLKYCENRRWIDDRIGNGASPIPSKGGV